jgi:predicted RNase H-like nuclease (RuvC/YqgF family)
VLGGEPYLDDPEGADLFAFLLENNEARQAVARGDDLREVIMRPVDTDAIQAEISQLEAEKRDLDDQLDRLDSLDNRLPGLEQQRTQLEFELGRLENDLEDVTDEIAEIEADLDERERLEEERDNLQEELADLRTQIKQLEALDPERIAALIEYFDKYGEYLVIALPPKTPLNLMRTTSV